MYACMHVRMCKYIYIHIYKHTYLEDYYGFLPQSPSPPNQRRRRQSDVCCTLASVKASMLAVASSSNTTGACCWGEVLASGKRLRKGKKNEDV